VTHPNLFVMREDLFSCDGTLIVPQGEIITPKVMEKICKNGAKRAPETFLLKKSEFFEDIRRVMNEENYRIIFNREETQSEVMEIIGRIPVTPEICREIDLFKAMDYYTYRHVLITTALTTLLYRDYSGDSEQVLIAASTALTHDFGKSRIPLDILQSSTKLDYEEFFYILEHPWIGYLLLLYYTARDSSPHAMVAFNHHEKIDGSGYPRGIHVENPIVQIVTICDMFDALISPRTYRLNPFSIRGALDYLYDEAEEGRLNLQGVKLLIAHNRNSKPALDSLICSRDHLGYVPPDENNFHSNHEDYQTPDKDDDFGTVA